MRLPPITGISSQRHPLPLKTLGSTGKVFSSHFIYLLLNLHFFMILAFSAAIDWSERWIIGLIGMEVALLVIVLVLWKSYDLQAAIFLFLCALIAFSERINSFCAEHWGSFATQNYFDVHGAFAITLFSGPLLFIMFTQLVS